MSTRRRLPLISLTVFTTLLFATAGTALAQHDPSSGGGVIGGGTISTGRPTNKPANRTTSGSTKPTRTTTTHRTTTSRPTTNKPSNNAAAENYYQQGEALYNQQKYREALDFYLKAIDINPSMATALYRAGWISNDMEEYDQALDYLQRV